MSAHKFIHRIMFISLLLVLALVAAACDTPRTPEPTATVTVLPTGVPSDTPSPTPPPAGPSITLTPVEGGPGALVTVNGSGWKPGDMIFIYLQDPSAASSTPSDAAVVQVAASVDGMGRLAAAFTFPSDVRWASLPGVLVTAYSPATADTASAGFRLIPATVTPPPTVAVPSSTPAGCTDRAAFVADMTIPDRTSIAPGAAFIKTWRLRNSGTCTWDSSYTVVFAGGDQLSGPSAVALPGAVPLGGTIDVSVSLTAPVNNGAYRGSWLLRNGKGTLFGIGDSAGQPFWVSIVVGPTPTPPPITAWRGEYYTNRNLTGSPAVVRNDTDVNFNWGALAPAAGLPADDFSARWTRSLNFSAGTYRFLARSDDGVRVWLNGELIIDQWHDATNITYSADRTLSAGTYSVRVEYYESKGDARVQLWWERPGDFPQWRGEYFSNVNLSGAAAVTRNDPDVNFIWGVGSPAQGVPADNFSARWTRTFAFEEGAYRFHAVVDDGVRLYVDGALFLDQWSDGARDSAVDLYLPAGNHTLRVEYYERGGNASIHVWWDKVGATYPDWKGEYWSNRDLSGNPVLTRNDATLDFNWGAGTPAQTVPVDNFSARWTRNATFDAATYRFHLVMDDGARIWVDDRLIIDEWRDGNAREVTADVALTQGSHRLTVEYYERTGGARIQAWWEKVAGSYPDWKGEFWNNTELSGAPVFVGNYGAIDFDWGENSPAPGVRKNYWSARWSRKVTFESGAYRFSAQSDDGIRVYLDGALIINEWRVGSGETVYTADRSLTGEHQLVVEYYDAGNLALARFSWKRIGAIPPTNTPTATPTATVKPSTATPTATSTSTGTPTATSTPTLTGTPTSTPTASPTAAPASGVRLNEVLPAPGAVDWNGDGTPNSFDAWVELTNVGLIEVDLSNWSLETGNGRSYVFPAGTVLDGGRYLVLYASQTGLVLDSGGDRVNLVDPLGQVMDGVDVKEIGTDRSLSRDDINGWHVDWAPSPGKVNLPVDDSGPHSSALRAGAAKETSNPITRIIGLVAEMIQTLNR